MTEGATNVTEHLGVVTKSRRAEQHGHRGAIVWFTGLSGSGKSTVAFALEEKLFLAGKQVFVLDGDNVRHGLCADLGFSADDRTENIRRIGEVARLFVEAGVIVLCSFVSPYRENRSWVRSLVDEGEFFEIHVSTPLLVCEARDPKGLYQRARAGEIPSFTGVSAPFESPAEPELTIDTSRVSTKEAIEALLELLREAAVLIS